MQVTIDRGGCISAACAKQPVPMCSASPEMVWQRSITSRHRGAGSGLSGSRRRLSGLCYSHRGLIFVLIAQFFLI